MLPVDELCVLFKFSEVYTLALSTAVKHFRFGQYRSSQNLSLLLLLVCSFYYLYCIIMISVALGVSWLS